MKIFNIILSHSLISGIEFLKQGFLRLEGELENNTKLERNIV